MQKNLAAPPPSLAVITLVFLAITMQSFGGGLSGWIRREVVQRRGWLTEEQFLSGLALCQIAPGPNAVNMSIFVGTTLRGSLGALAAVFGMVAAPMALVIVLGIGAAEISSYAIVGSVMAGIGATAVALNIATGVRMCRRGLRTPWAAAIALATTIAIGGFDTDFLSTVLIVLPISIGIAAWRRR